MSPRRSVCRLRLAAGVLASMASSGLGNARLSAAEIEPLALLWNAPTGCPTTQAIYDEVERSLEGSPMELAPVAAVVSVLEASEGRWRANLVVHSHGKRAERQFEAESCEALGTAAALLIALAAVGADDLSPTRPAGAIRPPERRDGPTITSAPPPGPVEPASAWNRSELFVVLGGLLDSGTMPGTAAAGGEAAAGQSWTGSQWRLRLIGGASLFVPRVMSESEMTFGPTGRYWMLSFSGRGCMTAALSRFELGPCLGGELAVMRATSIGGTSARSTQYWASPLGSAVAGFTVASGVVLFARTEIVFPSTRRTFLGDGNLEVYTVPAFALRGALGVELRLY